MMQIVATVTMVYGANCGQWYMSKLEQIDCYHWYRMQIVATVTMVLFDMV
jgi:hypothetical protein